MAELILLREVDEAFTVCADQHLRPLMRISSWITAASGEKQLITEEEKEIRTDQTLRALQEAAGHILLLHWRSRDAFHEFGDFDCLRLLLDHQSALASYFIDLFAQLHWMLRLFHAHLHWMLPLFHDCKLTLLVDQITDFCLKIYKDYRTKTKPKSDPSRSDKLKRAGQNGRMFLSDQLHCRMRELGFVNLDQPGGPLISLTEELGRGAFATVFKGVFESTHAVEMNLKKVIGDPVAVKMFTNDNHLSETGYSFGTHLSHFLSSDGSEVANEDARLKVELGRLVSAKHPNIVTPKGYIGKRPQGESGLVMEVMDESLHGYLLKIQGGSVPPLVEVEMLDLMLEIAKGMRFLHECNLMHRDLKPRNVLLRHLTDQDLGHKQRFEVKLADFGLTKFYSSPEDGEKANHIHTARVGTSCYMAPEVRGNAETGVTYEEKIDIFSYGTTCFNILIGNPDATVFTQSFEGFYEDVKTGEWKHWVQGLPKNLSYIVNLVGKCWETDPSMRPTFASLCLLLQHKFRCLFRRPRSFTRSYQIVWQGEVSLDSTDTRVISEVKDSESKFKVVELIARLLKDPQPASLNLVARLSDLYSQLAGRRDHIRAQVGGPYLRVNEVLDYFWEVSDPLILIEGVAVMSHRFHLVTEERLSSRRDFADASLLPLLVGFWTLPNFDVLFIPHPQGAGFNHRRLARFFRRGSHTVKLELEKAMDDACNLCDLL